MYNATQEEFRDEEIFNAIINTFIKMGKEYEKDIQLIVVNKVILNSCKKKIWLWSLNLRIELV